MSVNYRAYQNQLKRIHDELLIQQFSNFTQIQGRPTTQRYI